MAGGKGSNAAKDKQATEAAKKKAEAEKKAAEVAKKKDEAEKKCLELPQPFRQLCVVKAMADMPPKSPMLTAPKVRASQPTCLWGRPLMRCRRRAAGFPIRTPTFPYGSRVRSPRPIWWRSQRVGARTPG
jgi:hypothetical protein